MLILFYFRGDHEKLSGGQVFSRPEPSWGGPSFSWILFMVQRSMSGWSQESFWVASSTNLHFTGSSGGCRRAFLQILAGDSVFVILQRCSCGYDLHSVFRVRRHGLPKCWCFASVSLITQPVWLPSRWWVSIEGRYCSLLVDMCSILSPVMDWFGLRQWWSRCLGAAGKDGDREGRDQGWAITRFSRVGLLSPMTAWFCCADVIVCLVEVLASTSFAVVSTAWCELISMATWVVKERVEGDEWLHALQLRVWRKLVLYVYPSFPAAHIVLPVWTLGSGNHVGCLAHGFVHNN